MKKASAVLATILVLAGVSAFTRTQRGPVAGSHAQASTRTAPYPIADGRLQGQDRAPAPDLTGTWSGATRFSGGRDVFTIMLARKGESYTGTITDAAGLAKQVPLEDVRNVGGGLAFSFTASLASQDLRFEAMLKPESGRLLWLVDREAASRLRCDTLSLHHSENL